MKKEVRVFTSPRRVAVLGENGQPVMEGDGTTPKTVTALRLRMNALEVGVWRLKAASGVSHQTLANLANDKGGVELKKAERIAAALDVSLGELFTHKDGADLVGA